jgi:transposase
MAGGVQLGNQRKSYTPEFKQEAIDLVAKHGYTVAEAARNLGIRRNTLDRWRREQQQKPREAFPGSGHQSGDAAELKRLREENRKLKLEREILKKAAAFFAKEAG